MHAVVGAGPHGDVDRDRGPHRYAHEGDPGKCSPPPAVVLDGDGKELGAIPNEPVVVGSRRDKELASKAAPLYDAARAMVAYDCTGNVRPKPQ